MKDDGLAVIKVWQPCMTIDYEPDYVPVVIGAVYYSTVDSVYYLYHIGHRMPLVSKGIHSQNRKVKVEIQANTLHEYT